LYNNDRSGTETTLFDPTLDACPGLTGTIKDETDVLAIKRVSGTALTTGQTDGVTYLRTNGTVGSFVNNAASVPPVSGVSDWQYLPRIYYIRDDAVPSLCRLDLNGLAFDAIAADECLAEGIEDLHVQFGIDTDGDGVANQYVSDPTQAEANTAVSARLYVLVRSAEEDHGYTNTKSHRLGDIVIPAQNDKFYRRVYNTTVTLRNSANRLQLN
jgi:type IV pilus assembly protein PilW